MTVHVAYDPAIFLTQAEFENQTHSNRLLQSVVEMPLLYLFAGGSSSIEDQAAIISDRIDCLRSLSEPVVSSTGIPINDQLRFFIGDHPAQQFERGTQIGGKYKCGNCGMTDEMKHYRAKPSAHLQISQSTQKQCACICTLATATELE